jgi:2,5-diketo-D-gluconate reductase B
MEHTADRTVWLQSGASMPVLGLGTWELTGSACERVVRQALDLGYRHIDTAELYGNETEIGRALRGMAREPLFITSKVSPINMETEDVVRACNDSLRRLRLQYLDLYLLHWPNDAIPIERTMDGLLALVAQGKVKSIGVSNFDVSRLEEAMSASEVPLCNNQVEYHPLRPRREIPQFCQKHGIVVTAYCPLARGAVLKDVMLRQIGEHYGKSAAQVSLAWLLRKGAVVIPKASALEHLKANRDLDWELSDEDVEAIDALGIERRLVDSGYS